MAKNKAELTECTWDNISSRISLQALMIDAVNLTTNFGWFFVCRLILVRYKYVPGVV